MASFLQPQRILEFDPMDLYDLKSKLSILMPRFRDSLATNNTREYYQNLENLIIKGLAFFGGVVIVSGVIGMFFDNR